MTVVDLPKPDREIWVCDCGCATFELNRDGTATCAICSHIPSADSGAWFADVKGGPDLDDNATAPIQDVHGNGSVEFARRRISQIAAGPDVVAMIALRENGGVHTWSTVDTEERVKWLRRKVKDAVNLIADGAKRFYEKNS
jgi:hypothetical protein